MSDELVEVFPMVLTSPNSRISKKTNTLNLSPISNLEFSQK